MDPDIKELLSNLHDLHKQATVERSHFYVGRLVTQSIETIERLERNLGGRDEFLVKKGLWSEFVDQLPR
jgi:hypothetical protein